jgi:hypothetical protein
MFSFAGLSLIAEIVFLFILPETKGLSVEEIVEMFENMSKK